MSEQQKKYGLYVVRQQDIGADERHYLITPDYCLLYTHNPPPKRSAAVTSLKILPSLAREWLEQRVEIVRAEFLDQYRSELDEQTSAFVAGFLRELEVERMKLEATKEPERE